MKIQSTNKHYAGREVRFPKGIVVTFDSNCVAEVTDQEGKFLMSRRPNELFLEGKVPVTKTEIPKSQLPKDGSQIEVLNEKLGRANQLINQLKGDLARAQEAENIWRVKSEELLQEISVLKSQKLPDKSKTDEPKTDNKESEEKETEPETDSKESEEDETTKLKKLLTAKKKDELTAMVEELKLPKAEWGELNKDKLVDYIVEKTNLNNEQS